MWLQQLQKNLQTVWIEDTCIADTYSFSCYSSLCPYYSCLFSCLCPLQLETWRWSWQWISFCSCWVQSLAHSHHCQTQWLEQMFKIQSTNLNITVFNNKYLSKHYSYIMYKHALYYTTFFKIVLLIIQSIFNTCRYTVYLHFIHFQYYF